MGIRNNQDWVLEIIESPSLLAPTLLPTLFFRPSLGTLSQTSATRGNTSHTPRSSRTSVNKIQGKGLLFTLFPHIEKGWRPILNLQQFNKFVKTQHFKMVTLATIIPTLESGDCFLVLDLQDTYFHIASHLSHCRFLRFTLCLDHFQYKVLLFGLSTAP